MKFPTPFRIVVADPPWQFGDKLPKKRGAESHYPCMSTEDMCMLELPPIDDQALLFLWRVGAMQEEALAVMHMWGFHLKSELVWVKTKNGVVIQDDSEMNESDLAFGMGRYTRYCHEVCLIGTRCKGMSPFIKKHSQRSVFFAEREEHSKKPAKFFEIVEEMTDGKGPYLELFSRARRAGWVTLGNELGTTLTKRGTNEESGNGDVGSADEGSRGAEAYSQGGGRGEEGTATSAA